MDINQFKNRTWDVKIKYLSFAKKFSQFLLFIEKLLFFCYDNFYENISQSTADTANLFIKHVFQFLNWNTLVSEFAHKPDEEVKILNFDAKLASDLDGLNGKKCTKGKTELLWLNHPPSINSQRYFHIFMP